MDKETRDRLIGRIGILTILAVVGAWWQGREGTWMELLVIVIVIGGYELIDVLYRILTELKTLTAVVKS